MSIARLNASPTARLWIGGSPCSGKSTIASRLSSRYGFGLYHCDEHWDRHLASASAVAQPRMCRLRGMSADEIWLRPVDDQVEDELALYQEQFPMILSDLAGSVDRVVVAEGAALLPECVAPLITDPRQAVWIVPTEAFQRRTYRTRGPWVEQVLSRCSDPAECWERWMARDAAFALRVAEQANTLGLRVIWVDGSRGIDAILAETQSWLSSPSGLA